MNRMNRWIPALLRPAAVTKSILFSLFLLLTVTICQQAAQAQYLASTKAGFVNRVEGKVMIQRAGNSLNEAGRASLGTQMKPDDQLITTHGSRVELLLSPGSYLRLDENTRVRAVSTGFSAMRFEILGGSAIAEVSAEENATIKQDNPLEIITPQGSVAIAKTGLYRFDVKESYTDVSARRGEFFLGTRDEAMAGSSQKVKKERVARLTSEGQSDIEIAKLDKNSFDTFDEWSFQRAEMLVAAHRSVLSRSASLSTLASGWIFDPFYNCYTYMPFGRRFINAYGFGFYNNYSVCACNGNGYWYPYYGSGPYNSAGTTTGSSVTPSVTPRVRGDQDRSATIRRQVSVGRRVEVDPTYSPGFNSRTAGSDMWRSIEAPRSWGTSTSNVGTSSRSVGGPAVSPGRTDTGSRTVGDSGSGGRGGGRVVNN